MKLIEKLGKAMHLNKNNYDDECTYAWAVILWLMAHVAIALICMVVIVGVSIVIFGSATSIPSYVFYTVAFLGLFEEKLHVIEFCFTSANKVFDFVMSRIVRSVESFATSVSNSVDNTVKYCLKNYCKPIIKDNTNPKE